MIPKNIRDKAKDQIENPRPRKPLPDPRQVKAGIWPALLFTFFMALNFFTWKTGSFSDFEEWENWLGIGGMALFGPLAVFSWVSYFSGWSAHQEEHIGLSLLKWIFLGPIIFIIGGLALFFIAKWLLSIPSWAAVMIILQVLILIKKR